MEAHGELSSKHRQGSRRGGRQRATGKVGKAALLAVSAVAASAEGTHMRWSVCGNSKAGRVECEPWHHAAMGVWDVRGRWQQEWIDSAVRKLFPYEFTKGQKFPYIEDILHRPTFGAFWEWLADAGGDVDGPQGPLLASARDRAWRSAAQDVQRGTLMSRLAIDPLISFGLSRDEHFEQVQALAVPGCFPMDARPVCDQDLRFAAWRTVRSRSQLEAVREEDIACVEELAERLQPFVMYLH